MVNIRFSSILFFSFIIDPCCLGLIFMIDRMLAKYAYVHYIEMPLHYSRNVVNMMFLYPVVIIREFTFLGTIHRVILIKCDTRCN